MHRPAVKLAISRSHSKVRRPNHYTTEPPIPGIFPATTDDAGTAHHGFDVVSSRVATAAAVVLVEATASSSARTVLAVEAVVGLTLGEDASIPAAAAGVVRFWVVGVLDNVSLRTLAGCVWLLVALACVSASTCDVIDSFSHVSVTSSITAVLFSAATWLAGSSVITVVTVIMVKDYRLKPNRPKALDEIPVPELRGVPWTLSCTVSKIRRLKRQTTILQLGPTQCYLPPDTSERAPP